MDVISTEVPRLCRHFGTCGGCAAQDRPYAEQLAAKEAWVRRVLEPFTPRDFRPILPSPDVFYYRNKMEFAFGPAKRAGALGGHGPEDLVLGLREKGRFDRVVDLRDCLLMSPETPRLLEAVRAWARREGLAAYDLKSHRGFLRYLALREGKNTGQRLVHLVTAAGNLPKESFLRVLDESGVPVDSVVWSVNQALSDVARGDSTEVLRGNGTLTETLGGRPFRISPMAFFQTNSRGAEVLYGIITELLGPSPETLFDFYCGSGTIGLFCASRTKRLVGVESHAPSVEDARFNAAVQGAAHAEFHAMDAAEFVRTPGLLDLWSRPGSAAVMDPPRPGLQPAVRHLLIERPVERWVYVSCNPEALARDLPALRDVYDIPAVQPVDMFPHTPHVETVLLLERRT